MVTTTHSIHCVDTSGSHELPPAAATAAAAEGEHCILVWLGQPHAAGIMYYLDNTENV